MKPFIIIVAGMSLVLAVGCSTTQSTATKLADMELRPNATYCMIETPGGATALTNRLALDAFYQTRSLPTCELLYEAYYDFQAPTTKERVSELHQKIKEMEDEFYLTVK